MDPYIDFLKLIMPYVLIDHFDLIKTYKEGDLLHVFFEEKHEQPKKFSSLCIVSKGFYNEITIQDFPLRGQFVFLNITRRRWLNEDTGKVVFRDWNLVADGTRITDEFASFLKEIGRF